MKSIQIVKNKKGITLIALVVTIVVLLILAGVTILTLTGENGILKRASNAAEATQKETAKEKMNFKITNIQINTYAKEQRMPTLQEIADEFYEDDEIEYVITKEEVAAKEKIDVTGYNSIFTKLEEYPYEFEIDSSLRLASINGVKIADTDSSGQVDNETIKQMQQKILELENNLNTANQKTTELENSLNEAKSELETTKSNVENLAVSAITRETLFEATAGTAKTEYTISDISKYKYLIIYTDCLTIDKTKRVSRSSRIINVSDIVYNNSTTLTTNSLFAITEGIDDADYSILYYFKSSTKLYVYSLNAVSWSSPRIYKIEGIK